MEKRIPTATHRSDVAYLELKSDVVDSETGVFLINANPVLTVHFADMDASNNFIRNGGMRMIETLTRRYLAQGPQQEENDMAKKANSVVATVEVVNNGWQVTLGMFGYRQNPDDAATREQRHVFTDFGEMASFLKESIKPLKDLES